MSKVTVAEAQTGQAIALTEVQTTSLTGIAMTLSSVNQLLATPQSLSSSTLAFISNALTHLQMMINAIISQ